MPTITYTIQISHESGVPHYVPLTAKTDLGAIRQMRSYIKTHIDNPGRAYLNWSRSADGCSGFINPDGNASATGRPWSGA